MYLVTSVDASTGETIVREMTAEEVALLTDMATEETPAEEPAPEE